MKLNGLLTTVTARIARSNSLREQKRAGEAILELR
jgi:hypothetical protein